MKSFLQALPAILISGMSLNAIACEHPPLVMIPAEEDMDGQEEDVAEATQEYFLAMQEFVECIQAELDSAGDNPPALYRSMLVQRNNAAVAEAEAVQAWFTSRFPQPAGVPVPAPGDNGEG